MVKSPFNPNSYNQRQGFLQMADLSINIKCKAAVFCLFEGGLGEGIVGVMA